MLARGDWNIPIFWGIFIFIFILFFGFLSSSSPHRATYLLRIMSTLPIPSPATILHIYRHLLREASYLPLVARPYITERIKTQFRTHQRASATGGERVRKAYHGLRYLRAANTGSLSRLRKILLLAFGRTGRRRRELLSSFFQRESPADSAALETLIEAGPKSPAGTGTSKRDKDWLDRWDVDKLTKYAKSQATQGLVNTPQAALVPKQTDPTRKIPAQNIWGDALAPKLARSKLRKGWKEIIKKVLPPVSLGEWELLRDLSAGKRPAHEWHMPARRVLAREISGGPADDTAGGGWEWAAYVKRPIRQVEAGQSRRRRLMSGATDDNSPNAGPPIGIHRYTPRLMARLYNQVWAMTATAEKAHNKGLEVTWGRREPHIPTAKGSATEFFEGAPEVPAAQHSAQRKRTSS